MPEYVKACLRAILKASVRLISPLFFKIHVQGREHIPTDRVRPLMVIANHFSWFDAMFLSLVLPFPPVFLVATESRRHWWVRAFIDLYDGIPVWRGQVDRDALRLAEQSLANGKVVAIFPEGGMNPEIADRVARGETILELQGHASRHSATLARGKPGSALLAHNSQSYILPVAVDGSEKVLDNLRARRRTAVFLRIGSVFGPLVVDPDLKGRARRQRLDALTDCMMLHIAALFPPERRGPYRGVALDATRPPLATCNGTTMAPSPSVP
jgi:1-acyl-sn-glycerol-3-phosphate acyltransferase